MRSPEHRWEDDSGNNRSALEATERLLLRSLDAARMYCYESDSASGHVRRRGSRCGELGIDEIGHIDAFRQRIHLRDLAAFDHRTADCSPEHPNYSISYRFEKPDGGYWWLQDDGELIFDDQGRPRKLVGTSRDITTKREAQLEVERQRRQLKAITDAMPALIAYVDDQERFRFVNRAYARQAQRPVERILGAEMAEVVGPAAYQLAKAHLQKALRGQRVVYESTLAHPESGEDVFTEVTYVPDRDEEGITQGCYVLIIDITKQKQTIDAFQVTERRLQRVIDGSSVGIAFARTSGTVVDANDAALRMLGITRRNFQRQGFNWRAAVRDEDWSQLETIVAELTGSGRMSPIELQLRQPNGRSQPVMVSSLAVGPGASGSSRDEHVVFLVDLSEQKRYEKSLHEARQLAERANESKSEFLANMSHEIRTPMSAIIGYLEILSRNLTRSDDLKCISIIRHNSHFLLDIINDILDISKIEAGKLALHKKRFQPEKLIADVRSLMDVRAAEKDLSLEVEFKGKIPRTIRSDDKRLKQILINLLGNAIKFTEVGGVRLQIQMDEDTEKLLFDVVDTGIGISDQQLAKLFQPFTQGDSSISREFGGSGLGLTISQRLAKLLGGKIRASSDAGMGSTFSLSVSTGSLKNVPLITPNLNERYTERPRRAAEPVSISGRILIVDDRRDIRFIAQTILEDAGATVYEAENGIDAIRMVQAAKANDEPFDLVVMDMQMPVMDGYAATRKLRQLKFNLPIIALTAHAMKGDRQRCLQAGCTDYLTKPLDGELILATLSRHLQTPDVSSVTRSLRILVVDDSIESAESVRMLLELDDHLVETAFSGAAAIQAIESHQPELVLLDLGLPDMSGFEVMKSARRLGIAEGAVFVAMTGRDNAEETSRAGFYRHLLKPLDMSELDQILSELR